METSDFSHKVSDVYQTDQQRRERLAKLVEKILQSIRDIDLELNTEDLNILKKKVLDETFKVLIIGEFNTGKSTLINALLGAEILPTKAIPATAIINILKYGETPKALLHFRDKDKDPVSVPITRLNEYVLIHNNLNPESAQKEIRDSPYSHIEIWYPLELCKNKVEIIDSPGLNEDKVREDITLDYLRKVDVVLFIMTSVRLGPAKSENETLKQLKNIGREEIFFVINQWDHLKLKSQQDEVKGRALQVLPSHTVRKNDIYFVSSLDALIGRLDNKPELQSQSGFLAFEQALHRFLAVERGRLKAVNGAKELRLNIAKIEKEAIPNKIELLKMPLGTLQAKYEDARKDLEELNLNKTEIINFLNREKTQITSMAESRVKDFFFMQENDISQWATEYDFGLSWRDVFDFEEKIEECTEGFYIYLNEKIKESFLIWNDAVFTPFMEERNESMFRELRRKAKEFEAKLEATKVVLGLSNIPYEKVSGGQELSPLERILAAAGGWAVGGLGAGAIGALLGWKEMAKSLLPNILTIIGTMVLSIPLLPAAIILLIVNAAVGINAVEKLSRTLREKALEEYRKNLRQESSFQAKSISEQVNQHLQELISAVTAGLERRISEIDNQVKAALNAHRKGAQEVDDQLKAIQSFESELTHINEELDAFITDLVTSKN